uniref:Uncharacterized protein n=1 Tax=Photinus pyralis TaxID=7054 RepID=A0A1Y1MY77_PHOPY
MLQINGGGSRENFLPHHVFIRLTEENLEYCPPVRINDSVALTKGPFSAQKPLFPKIQPVTLINQRLNTEDPVQHRYYGDETRRKRRWGNGRDWNMAPSSEGGWIRLWPMKSNESEDDVNNNTFYCNGNLNTKNMVAEVIKFSKLSKEIFKKHPNVTECQRNDFLSEGMGLNGEIWLPPL